MNKYEMLESMLENIFENDADIESALAEFPEFAEELRPLVESAMDASALVVPPASADVARRGRTRLLAEAAKMRDAAPAPRASFFDFRLATLTLTLLLIFFVGGTTIVQASASALPGDGLYVVKRGWEDVSLRFADKDKQLNLEAKYEEERREEVQELLGGGRLVAVRFEGVVTRLNGSKWEVAGVPVSVSEETEIDMRINIGSDVIVSGKTKSDGTVLAEKIILSGHPEGHKELPATPREEEEVDEPEEKETPEAEEENEDDDVEMTETPESDDDEGGTEKGDDDSHSEDDGGDDTTETDSDDDEDDDESDDNDDGDGDDNDDDDDDDDGDDD
ncbi:MAG: hypothetical protein GY755_15725 [Chloroflexi bacterium]|nr:hypothetical protein [Chloroflexota bacterium]